MAFGGRDRTARTVLLYWPVHPCAGCRPCGWGLEPGRCSTTSRSNPTRCATGARFEAYRNALESTLGPGSLDTLADEADLHIDNFVADAEQLYRNFMAAAAD